MTLPEMIRKGEVEGRERDGGGGGGGGGGSEKLENMIVSAH